MAVGLEPWIYTLRSYCASAVFVTLLFAAPILSSFGVADAKSYKHPSGFRPLLVSLFLLYLGDIAVLVIEAQSRGELPDAVASISMSIFAFTSAVQLEKLATLEKVQFSVSCIYLGSWFLLFTVEFFTIIWLWSRPSAALFPYPQFGIVFTAVELLAYIALSSLFYHACCERYESLTQSDIENAASESTGYGGDDDESEWDSNGCKADPLGIRMEVRKEVGELGGWWPFIKKFRIFLEFMWPFDNALLQLRFILTLFFVMAGRVISVYQPLQTALLLDALASGTDPWRPLAVVITIDFADTVCSFIVKLLWIDVGLHRDEKLKVKVQSHIMSLDFSFHSQAQPTDVIKAVDNAGSVDTLLDSFIFEFWMNLVTLVVAIVQMFHRYGLYVVLVCSHTALYYCIVEKQYVTVAAAEHDKCNTLRDEQERRRQGSVRGWSTVSNHNQANYETGFFSSAVRSWMSQRRRYQMICYGFNATQSAILFLGFATCFAFVIYKVQSGEGPIGDLVAFTGLWGFLLSPIDYFTSIVSDMIEDLLDTARLRRILEWEPSTQKGDQNLKCDTGKIEFQGVSFSYPGSNRLIIDNLSMVIEGGSTVAFVGPSGSGKSTMCNLLMGNLTPTAGTIFIDDQDIRTLKKDS